jgi:acetyltransferase-like isoleucine patch superfamily enzyme
MDNVLNTKNDIVLDQDIIIKQKNYILGQHIAIDKGFYCTTNLQIGNYTHVSPYVTIIGGKNSYFKSYGFNNIMCGARIICGSDRFDDSGLFGAMIPDKYKGKQIISSVTMEHFSNVGTNAIILPGSVLRKGVLVTAGSLLMGDTEEWGVYKGNPAKLVKKIDGSKILQFAKELGYQEENKGDS